MMRWLIPLCALLWCGAAHAQGYIRIPSCNTASPPAGSNPGYMDMNGNVCVGGLVNGTVKPQALTQVPLDVASVTTGGTAVAALSAGHATAGGFVVTANSAGICVNEIGTAGTASSGNTTCVAQNVPYYLAPTTNAVSVNSSASSVTLAGYGYQ